MDEFYAETDLLLADQVSMDLITKNRSGANGTTEGRSSTVSTDDEPLDIGDGRMEALWNWADLEEMEPKCSNDMAKLCNENEHDEVRIVMVGKTGNWKSTTMNAILGRTMLKHNNLFDVYPVSASRFQTLITLVPTPGLLNAEDITETCRTIQSEKSVSRMHFAVFYNVYQKMTESDSILLDTLIEKMNSATRHKLFLVLTDCEDITDNLYTKSALPVLRINSTLQDNQEADYQIKKLIKEIKLKEKIFETYPAVAIQIFHSTRILLIIVIVLSHSVRAIVGDPSQVIHWKLMTKPVYFGHDVDLVCIIKTEDTSEPMAWIRIPNGETIAYNKIPIDDTKYRIDVQYDDTKMVYNLTIKQFNSTDVNRAYRCDFGFYSYADNLLLNDRDFISMPSKKDMESKFTLVEETLIGRVKIENCFPRPLCTGIFQGMNISEFMTISYTNVSIFFNTNIEIKYSTKTCGGSVNVTCTFGDSILHFNELVGDCSEKSNPKLTVVLIIIGIILGVALGVVFVLIRKRGQLSCCKLGLESHLDATYYDREEKIAKNRNDHSEVLENLTVPETVSTRNDSGIELSTLIM